MSVRWIAHIRIDEIARLLSGEEISDAARKNAEDLLDAAGQGA